MHKEMGGVSITLIKRLIIKFMRAGVTKPHHSAAMRQVVKESLLERLREAEEVWREDEMEMKPRRDLCDKLITLKLLVVSSLSLTVFFFFFPLPYNPKYTHTHTPHIHTHSQLPFPQCVFLRHWYSPLQRAEISFCHVNMAHLYSYTQTQTHTTPLRLSLCGLSSCLSVSLLSLRGAEELNQRWPQHSYHIHTYT